MVKRGKEWSRDVRGGHRRCEVVTGGEGRSWG